MVSVNVVNLQGKVVSNLELVPVEGDLGSVHQALIRQLNNARIGSANTLTRAEVRGGGRKPWRQKGTGRARAGSIRSPLWVGGGVIFGPKPRDYSVKMNRKARRHALAVALSACFDKLTIIENFDSFTEFSTSSITKMFSKLDLNLKTVLIILDYNSETANFVLRSARNINGVKVIAMNNANVKDIAQYQAILTSKAVISELANDLLNASISTTN